MALAIKLSEENIKHSGGPFGAAVFDMDTHQLISVGINLVVSTHCSNNHAEMVALALAQQSLQSFTLKGENLPRCELVSSCEPCAMCFGAIPWSGIQHLTYGATAADAEAIGFDEGPKHPNWICELEKRGITVSKKVLSSKAASVLTNYKVQMGTIYNA